MTDTPTPRTDAQAVKHSCDHPMFCNTRLRDYASYVPLDFARTLERDLTACRAALRAADALRNAAVDLMQTHCIPDSRMTDDEVVERMYEIFDGPLQRAYDAARAILQSTGDGEGK